MWPFKKKEIKEKVYCSLCKHYKLSVFKYFSSNHDCYANYYKLEDRVMIDTPIYKGEIIKKQIGIEDAWDKNFYNDCKDYESKLGEN